MLVKLYPPASVNELGWKSDLEELFIILELGYEEHKKRKELRNIGRVPKEKS
jgi:hypothetical protein